jgi:hypothetical protein
VVAADAARARAARLVDAVDVAAADEVVRAADAVVRVVDAAARVAAADATAARADAHVTARAVAMADVGLAHVVKAEASSSRT